MRLRGLVRKEFLQIVRDPSSIAIAVLMPVVLLLVFGYGVSLDAEHVPVALVVERPSADTASFTAAFRGSRYFAPAAFLTLRDAEQARVRRRSDGARGRGSGPSTRLAAGTRSARPPSARA